MEGSQGWGERGDEGGLADRAPREKRSDSFVLETTVQHEATHIRRIERLDDLLGRIDMLEWMVMDEQHPVSMLLTIHHPL